MIGGIIAGALGGGAQAISEIGDANLKARELEEREARAAATTRENALYSHRLSMERFAAEADRKLAPYKRLSGMLDQQAGVEVPVDAASVTRLSGAGTAADGKPLTQGGFQGDLNEVRAMIERMPDGPDKKAAQAQLVNQLAADTEAAKGLVSGKMRKRTADEVFDAAMNQAKTSDIEAYLAGLPAQKDKFTNVSPGATVLDSKGNVVFDGSAAIERKAAIDLEKQRIAEEGRDRRADARLDAMLAKASKASGGDGVKETLSFLEGSRKLIAEEALRLNQVYTAQIKDASPKERRVIDADFEVKRAEIAKRYRQVDGDFAALRTRLGLSALPTPDPVPSTVTPDNRTPAPANRPPLSSFMKGR